MKHVTIKDIARHLSISASTVSRALVNDKNVRKETKEKVLNAARELNYKPNPVATNLKYGHSNTVGVIVPEMVTPFASTVVSGIQSVLYAHGIKVIVADSRENPDMERENLRLMEQFMVDGIIVSLCSYRKNREDYLRLQKAGMPMVFYDRIPYGLDVPQVLVDDYRKSFFLVEKLILGGRKKIVHIQGPEDIYNSKERLKGYMDAMAKYKIPVNESTMVIRTGMTFDEGAEAAERLVGSGMDFDAIFAFTDTLAIGVMNRLRELGKRIPDEVAIASFSGTELSTIVYPKLTTVEPPLFQMGEKAAELILEKIKNPACPNRKETVNAEIRMRESSGIRD